MFQLKSFIILFLERDGGEGQKEEERENLKQAPGPTR